MPSPTQLGWSAPSRQLPPLACLGTQRPDQVDLGMSQVTDVHVGQSTSRSVNFKFSVHDRDVDISLAEISKKCLRTQMVTRILS